MANDYASGVVRRGSVQQQRSCCDVNRRAGLPCNSLLPLLPQAALIPAVHL
jgi:hypothetical protein